MDMKVSGPGTPFEGFEGSSGIYYAVLYGIISFLLVMVALLLLYVACSKRFRINWFERSLLEDAETTELATSQEALMRDGTEVRRSHSVVNRDEEGWVPVGRAADLDTSEDESDGPQSPSTSRGSKSSLAVDSLRGGTDDLSCSGVVPIARSDKHVVLAVMPANAKPIVSMNTRLDLSKIDTTLYEQPAVVCIEPEENVKGRVHITLAYDTGAGMLSVRLIEAEKLVPKEYQGCADPYAKIRLLPDKSNVWQTRIHKKTLNPVFDEDFVFEVRAQTLNRRTLEIILFDFDPYARHTNLGGLKLPLSELDLTEKVTMWRTIAPCLDVDDKAELGELLVSLSFLPSAERLTVVVMKARNLRVIDDTRASSDPFVKVTLSHGGKRLKKKKTSIHRNTVNPTYNERLTFDVSKDLISKCFLDLSVYHDVKHGTGELLGRCLIGAISSCAPEDREFFQELLTNKSANAKWLTLTDPR